MKLILKEEPKEWRKAAWMSALGLAVLSSMLCWRRVAAAGWCGLWFCFCWPEWLWRRRCRPQWFRGYYRFSTKLGFGLSQIAGYAVLALFFFVVITPLGTGSADVWQGPVAPAPSVRG